MRLVAFQDFGRLVREDAARWILPEQVADAEDITFSVLVRLLMRHLPLRATAWYRVASLAHRLGVRGVPSLIQRRLLVRFGLELAPSTKIGGGLYIAHPVGCVLVANGIGRNLTVIGAATFGARGNTRWPRIGDDVFVGMGARILGDVEIGDRAVIGAGAVVLESVSPDDTAIGVPARSVPKATPGARRSER